MEKCITHNNDLCYCDRPFVEPTTQAQIDILKVLLYEVRSDFPVTFDDSPLEEVERHKKYQDFSRQMPLHNRIIVLLEKKLSTGDPLA